jgi:hypothetical protein
MIKNLVHNQTEKRKIPNKSNKLTYTLISKENNNSGGDLYEKQ